MQLNAESRTQLTGQMMLEKMQSGKVVPVHSAMRHALLELAREGQIDLIKETLFDLCTKCTSKNKFIS